MWKLEDFTIVLAPAEHEKPLISTRLRALRDLDDAEAAFFDLARDDDDSDDDHHRNNAAKLQIVIARSVPGMNK